MALTSLRGPAPEPEPLGPLPPGHRRVMFTSSYNMAGLNASKDEVRDVPLADAETYVANNMAIMFDDLPEPEPEPEPELECPPISAPKSVWVEWAVYKGSNKLEAQILTKAQLQNEYGERL